MATISPDGSVVLCGGDGILTPEAAEELVDFREYLILKGRAKAQGTPFPYKTFNEWRGLKDEPHSKG